MQQEAKQAEPGPTAVIVMGVSGCGKSTVGALLAEALGCPFLEGDTLHDPAAIEQMRRGIPLTDDDRWPWLDRIGHAASRLAVSGGAIVVACSALRRAYRERLQAAIGVPTRFVMLDNTREEIQRRLLARAHAFMPSTLLDSQFATLERPADDEPVRVLFSDVPPEALCRMAVNGLTTGPG